MPRKKKSSAKSAPADKTSSAAPRPARGCEIVIDALEREEAKVVFGFPGGAIIDVFDLVNQSKEIDFILINAECIFLNKWLSYGFYVYFNR